MTLTLKERWEWLKALWQTLMHAKTASKDIAKAIPPSAHPTGDIMQTITVEQLKALGALLGGGDVQKAISGVVAGKADGFLLTAETVAGVVGVFLPQAALVAGGIEALRKVLPVLEKMGAKPISPSDPNYNAAAGNGGFVL